jgi:hypothetical protein
MALAGAAYAVWSRPGPTGPVCDCETSSPAAEVAALRRRVEAAEAAVARGAMRQVAGVAVTPRPRDDEDPLDPQPPSDDTGDAPAVEDEDTAPPQYVGFEVGERGITVVADEGGGLRVHNTDPTRVGETLTIQGRTADGRLENLTITVPPVE